MTWFGNQTMREMIQKPMRVMEQFENYLFNNQEVNSSKKRDINRQFH